MTTRIVFLVPNREKTEELGSLQVLLEGLPRDTYDLHVLGFSRDAHATAKKPSGTCNIIQQRHSADLPSWWNFRATLRKLRPDVVHVWKPFQSAWTTLLADLVHRGTVVATVEDAAPRLFQHPSTATRLICRRPYHFITTTSSLHSCLMSAGVAAHQCNIIPSPIPPASPTGDKCDPRTLFSLPSHCRLIGSLDPMASWKQIQDIIWITAVLKVATDDIHLVLQGQGVEKQRLQRFAEQAEIDHHVHWIDPTIPPEQWLPALNCYVSTTNHLGHATGILHATANGLPVTAMDCLGNRDLVRQSKTGQLTPRGDCGSLARQIWKILDDPSLARQLGQQGQQRYNTLFQPAKMVGAYHAIYQTLPLGHSFLARHRDIPDHPSQASDLA